MGQKRRRLGCPQCHEQLKREGFRINHKRIERLYALEKLQIRKRRRTKRSRTSRVPPPEAKRITPVRAMDFIFDVLTNGWKLKILSILDVYTRKCMRIGVDTSINAKRVVGILNELA